MSAFVIRSWMPVRPDAEMESVDPSARMFTVMSWNILADGLAQNGGFSVEPSLLTWEFRWPRIVQEIRCVSPDILCLMEANMYEDISTTLHQYVLLFAPKLSSAALNATTPSDGCMVLLRRSRFTILQVKVCYLTDPTLAALSNQNAILVHVKDAQTEQTLLVVTSHLKAKGGVKNAELRNNQVKEILREISAFLANVDEDIPVIFCGDFNGSPTEPLYKSILLSPLKFKSVYNSNTDYFDGSDKEEDVSLYAMGEPAFTTWKFRDEGGEKKCTIDYMFMSTSPRLITHSVYRLPNEEELSTRGLPSDRYPSDHISIACQFQWKLV